jgi:ATP-dependent DNA ligase
MGPCRRLKSSHPAKDLSRGGEERDFAPRYPPLVQVLAPLPDETAIDGESVALDRSGRARQPTRPDSVRPFGLVEQPVGFSAT